MKNIVVPVNKDLYIRIPDSLKKVGKLGLIIPDEYTNKTIKISIIDNEDAPFDKDAIYCEDDSLHAFLTYFGSVDCWKPNDCPSEEYTLDYSECGDLNCHNTSCPVYQKFISSDSEGQKILHSTQVK